MPLNPDSLTEVLSALADELAVANEAAYLVVIGGSALLAGGVITRPTRDLDVVGFRSGEGIITAEPLPPAVVAAAARVAFNFGLSEDWLNGRPTSLLDIADGLPYGFDERVLTRRYGTQLTVDFAGRLDLIHLKLYALADRGEPRDRSDLDALAPSADELRQAAAWARTHNAPGPFDEQLARTLNSFGVADVGRRAE